MNENPQDRLSVPKQQKHNLNLLTNLFLIFVSVAVIAVLTVLVYNTSQNKSNGDLLVDCTTPKHDCYERSLKQTEKAISSITEVAVAANYCSLKVSPPYTDAYFDEFVACVKRLVTER